MSWPTCNYWSRCDNSSSSDSSFSDEDETEISELDDIESENEESENIEPKVVQPKNVENVVSANIEQENTKQENIEQENIEQENIEQENTEQENIEQEDIEQENIEPKDEEETREFYEYQKFMLLTLSLVFRYLNGRDLSSAAMVDRCWYYAAREEITIRGPFIYTRFYASSRYANLNKFKNKLPVRPCAAILFITVINPVEDYTVLLPNYCKTIGICTSSILTNNAHPIINRRIKTYVFLPFISDTTIKTFPITFRRNNYSDTPELLYKCLFDELENVPIPNTQVSTFLLLFCNNSGDDNLESGFVHTIHEFVRNIQKEYGAKVSLTGAIICKTIPRAIFEWSNEIKQFDSFFGCSALLISGRICSSTIIIDERCVTREQIKEKLSLFRKRTQLKRYGVAFIFKTQNRCAIDDKEHRQHDIEIIIFTALFPEVPLVGCISNTVFGKDILRINEGNEDKGAGTSEEQDKDYTSDCATIITVLTY